MVKSEILNCCNTLLQYISWKSCSSWFPWLKWLSENGSCVRNSSSGLITSTEYHSNSSNWHWDLTVQYTQPVSIFIYSEGKMIRPLECVTISWPWKFSTKEPWQGHHPSPMKTVRCAEATVLMIVLRLFCQITSVGFHYSELTITQMPHTVSHTSLKIFSY